MEALLDWLEKHWGWLLPLLASCIKVKPMEVSPMVWLLRKVGNALTGDLRQQRFLLGRGQGVVKMQQMLLPVPGKVLLCLCVIHMLFFLS